MRYAWWVSVRLGVLISSFFVAQLGVAQLDLAQAWARTPTVVAQAAQPATNPTPNQPANAQTTQSQERARVTERARARVSSLTSQRDKARAAKGELAREYETQLAEIDRLKKRRASWRRDRLIRDRMGKSHGTAKKLAAADKRLRQLEGQVRKARRQLVTAIDGELAANPSATRRASLTRWRRTASRGLRRGAKKIVLPDDSIDPLADPEELEYQASLIRQSEEQLARELHKLDRQSKRYNRMAALQKNRRRAAALGRFDDDRPRRSVGTPNGRNESLGDAADSPLPGGPEVPPTDIPPGSGTDDLDPDIEDSMFDVVLADVVDASTVSALRSAGSSSDPKVKAKAAERARKQVQSRLERLRKQRKEIQKRARTLRR